MADTREDFLTELDAHTAIISKFTSDHVAAVARVRRAQAVYNQAELDFRAEFPRRTLADEVRAQGEVDRRRRLGMPGYVLPAAVPGPSAIDRHAAGTTGGNIRGRNGEQNFRRGSYPASAQNRIVPKPKLPSQK